MGAQVDTDANKNNKSVFSLCIGRVASAVAYAVSSLG